MSDTERTLQYAYGLLARAENFASARREAPRHGGQLLAADQARLAEARRKTAENIGTTGRSPGDHELRETTT